MADARGRTAASLIAAVLVFPFLLGPAGCGGRPLTSEEALGWVRRAYSNMATASGYRYRAEMSYSFPDLDEATRVRLAAALPDSLIMEGEVSQSGNQFRQHAVGSSGGEKLELFVVNGKSYQRLGEGEWKVADTASWRLNLSGLDPASPEGYQEMLAFAGEARVLEDTPQRLVIAFEVQSGSLLSSLEKSRGSYPPEEEETYRALLAAMASARAEVTTHIYRSNGYLERQDVVIQLPEMPLLGKVLMEMRTYFSSYGEEWEIILPPEAEKAGAGTS